MKYLTQILTVLIAFVLVGCKEGSSKKKVNDETYEVKLIVEGPIAFYRVADVRDGAETLDVKLFAGGKETLVQGAMTINGEQVSNQTYAMVIFPAPSTTEFVQISDVNLGITSCSFGDKIAFSDIISDTGQGDNGQFRVKATCSDRIYSINLQGDDLIQESHTVTVLGSINSNKFTQTVDFTTDKNTKETLLTAPKFIEAPEINIEDLFDNYIGEEKYRKIKDDFESYMFIYNVPNTNKKVELGYVRYEIAAKSDDENILCKFDKGAGIVSHFMRAVVENGFYDHVRIYERPQEKLTCARVNVDLSGTIKGLMGKVNLKLPGGVEKEFSSNDAFVSEDMGFNLPGATALYSDYEIVVAKSPDHQVCTAKDNATGKMVEGNISGIVIECINKEYTLTIDVTTSKTDSIQISSDVDTAKIVNKSYQYVGKYSIFNLVATPVDATQTCTFERSSENDNVTFQDDESITVKLSKNTNVKVVCTDVAGGGGSGGGGSGGGGSTPATYTLKANVSGLSGGTLTLRNQINLNQLAITTNGLHTFSQAITSTDGYDYDVRVFGQPAGQTCTLSGDVGTASADVTVTVTCSATTPTYTVGGVVHDIPVGMSLTLRLTYGSTHQDKTISWDVMSNPVSFTFDTAIANGESYTITVQTQPMGGTCSVDSGGTGTVSGANITNASISCL